MLKNLRIEWVVIIALLIWIVVQTCTAPDKYDPAAEIYKDSTKVLKSEKAIISSRIASILETSRSKERSDSTKLAASLKEISRLKVKASQAVERIPVRVMEENPEIQIALTYKDSVITKQGQAIDSLQQSLAFQIQVKDDLMSDHYNADKINAQLQEMAQARIVSLEKDLKKERRKGRFAKVLIPIVGVAGLLLGSNL